MLTDPHSGVGKLGQHSGHKLGAASAALLVRHTAGRLAANDHLGSPGSTFTDAATPVDHHMLRGHQPRHDGFAQPGTGVDDHLVPRPRDRVGGEEHSRELRRHHALHDHGDLGHGGILQPCPVGHGSLCPQRCPAPADRRQDRVAAEHVEEGLLLSGKRRGRQVLRRGAGAHRDRPLTQLPIGANNLRGQRWRNRHRLDPRPHQGWICVRRGDVGRMQRLAI